MLPDVLLRLEPRSGPRLRAVGRQRQQADPAPNSYHQSLIGLPRACLGIEAATRSAKFSCASWTSASWLTRRQRTTPCSAQSNWRVPSPLPRLPVRASGAAWGQSGSRWTARRDRPRRSDQRMALIPVSQCLPVHAAERGSLGPGVPIQHQRQSQHAPHRVTGLRCRLTHPAPSARSPFQPPTRKTGESRQQRFANPVRAKAAALYKETGGSILFQQVH